MTKEKKILMLVVVAIITIAMALSGCEEEVVENKIIVGTSADFPPFEYVEDGVIVGFDIEMITMILENLNYTVEVQDIAFEGLIGALNSDKIDVIAAAMSIDPEREVDFSNPYFEADLSVLVLTESNITLNESNYLTVLSNFTIGAQTGTTGADWVYETLINITNATMTEDDLILYTTYTLAIIDLTNGNLDAVVIDKPVADAFAEDEDKEVAYVIDSDEEYGLAVKKGNSELLAELNQGLADLMGTQDWTDLIKKYFE
jgi:polar amino acid transport system substrate-binding protein